MSSAGQGRSAHMGQRRGEDLITSSARTSRRSASGLRLASSFAWARARFGFVRTDTLNQLRADKRITNAHRHITYITRPREADIRQLAGKKVSFDVKGSGTDYTGRSMFKGLGLEVEAVNIDQATALDVLKQGELSAAVSVAAKAAQLEVR